MAIYQQGFHHFPVDLERNEVSFSFKSIGKYNLISIDLTTIRNSFSIFLVSPTHTRIYCRFQFIADLFFCFLVSSFFWYFFSFWYGKYNLIPIDLTRIRNDFSMQKFILDFNLFLLCFLFLVSEQNLNSLKTIYFVTCFVSNESENGKYILIPIDLTRIRNDFSIKSISNLYFSKRVLYDANRNLFSI